MKKILGVLFLVIGLLSLVLGMAAFIDAETRNKKIDEQVQNEFSVQDRADVNEQREFGGGALLGGLFLFVGGLILASTKTKEQKQKEAELETLKNNINKLSAMPNVNSSQTDDTLTQLERLAELKAKGMLTEAEVEQQKKKILD